MDCEAGLELPPAEATPAEGTSVAPSEDGSEPRTGENGESSSNGGSTAVDNSSGSTPHHSNRWADLAGRIHEPLPVPHFLLDIMHGISQSCFVTSSLSGSLVMLALLVGDVRLAGLAIIGCASATAAARLMGLDDAAIRDGLLGYSATLHGCAFSAFLGLNFLWTALAAAAAGAVSVFLVTGLGKVLKPVPQFTLAFNIVTITVLAVKHAVADGGSGSVSTGPGPMLPRHNDFFMLTRLEYLQGALNGVSQMFFVTNPASGIIVVVAILWVSPCAALATVMGSLIGMLGGAAVGADVSDLRAGIWGFNGALAALWVTAYHKPLRAIHVASTLGAAVLATALLVGFKQLFAATLATPCLSLPFCTAGWMYFFLCKAFGGIMAWRSREVSSDAGLPGSL